MDLPQNILNSFRSYVSINPFFHNVVKWREKKGLTFAVQYWKELKSVGTWKRNWLK